MEKITVVPTRVHIAATLRKSILNGEIKAGGELSLTDVAAKLGVSRTPVREAFQVLSEEGLIQLRMNRSAIVMPLDENYIIDHFETRALLEGEAAARAIRVGMDPAPLEQLQKKILETSLEERAKIYSDYNQSFHLNIWCATNSPRLVSFIETIWNGPSYSCSIADDEHQRLSIAEHQRIIETIRSGDIEGGREAMRAHILRGLENFLEGYRMGKAITP
ncbi:MAG: GntR family transcriptional regulator [Faecalispora sporosphaeroides]|uniref:GntR family transcriptional regulator n=1 Tax=Faecalispora TaxID=3115229 RepID=UPI0004B2900E|nr:GntR family transcriptional regulator [Faecalispora jeddahensis]